MYLPLHLQLKRLHKLAKQDLASINAIALYVINITMAVSHIGCLQRTCILLQRYHRQLMCVR
jgi:hypothetical protein